jgi:dTDP-4-dehydrorhamnose 3,5-epimerase-like enzyme
MSQILELKTFKDERGNLTVIENILPFNIKRIYYIYDVKSSVRGKHRHKETVQAAVAISGSCKIYLKNSSNSKTKIYDLNSPTKCLIIKPEDYHWMDSFSDNCVLLVFASHNYDPDDYIYASY